MSPRLPGQLVSLARLSIVSIADCQSSSEAEPSASSLFTRFFKRALHEFAAVIASEDDLAAEIKLDGLKTLAVYDAFFWRINQGHCFEAEPDAGSIKPGSTELQPSGTSSRKSLQFSKPVSAKNRPFLNCLVHSSRMTKADGQTTAASSRVFTDFATARGNRRPHDHAISERSTCWRLQLPPGRLRDRASVIGLDPVAQLNVVGFGVI